MQPQTLQGAVLFSYLNAGIAILALLSSRSLLEIVILAGGIGAFGIANEHKWGYYLCLVAAAVFFAAQILLFFYYPFVFAALLNLLFSAFLVAFLLNPVSRHYVRTYFT